MPPSRLCATLRRTMSARGIWPPTRGDGPPGDASALTGTLAEQGMQLALAAASWASCCAAIWGDSGMR
jgi:hypothetical protein